MVSTKNGFPSPPFLAVSPSKAWFLQKTVFLHRLSLRYQHLKPVIQVENRLSSHRLPFRHPRLKRGRFGCSSHISRLGPGTSSTPAVTHAIWPPTNAIWPPCNAIRPRRLLVVGQPPSLPSLVIPRDFQRNFTRFQLPSHPNENHGNRDQSSDGNGAWPVVAHGL